MLSSIIESSTPYYWELHISEDLFLRNRFTGLKSILLDAVSINVHKEYYDENIKGMD